jgi:hypothetical protein
LANIKKYKDDICKHLEAGNEANALIWGESLINEEGLIPCMDIVSIYCDQLLGRMAYIKKFGAPKDMNEAISTLIHCAPKL